MPLRPHLGRMSITEAQDMLTGLVARDMRQLRDGARSVSSGLRSGRLRYLPADPREEWLSVREIWANGGGDCEDLAAAVAAERTLQGIPARVAIIKLPTSGDWHAVVEHIDTGRREDPSQTGGYKPQRS